MTAAQKKHIIFLLTILSIGIAITNIINKKMQNYFDKTVEITRCDGVNIKVTSNLRYHGYYYFNDTLYIRASRIEKHSYLYQLYDKLELPFYLKKEANNDTLWIIDNKETSFFVFRKDRGIDCE